MIFTTQNYALPDKPMTPFVDAAEINRMLAAPPAEPVRVRDILAASLGKKRLSMEETAALLSITEPDMLAEMRQAAHTLKENIYGDRIVLFAPLYVGNRCTNSCRYCGFRVENKMQKRHTLTQEELRSEVAILEDNGHKRLILVFGEHPDYTPDFIADTVRQVYSIKSGPGAIRRVNINAAPQTIEGFRAIKESGIGTYQIFQETYHQPTYESAHPSGAKSDYVNRLVSLDRAQEAGIDDVGLGVLFGLHDWRFEVLAMIRHVNHLEAVYGVGPHTLSFPRLKAASGADTFQQRQVGNEDFLKIITILRLAVPYTGLILTAREPVEVRQTAMSLGVSQIDGGTNIQLGGYSTGKADDQDLHAEQFQINDPRPLAEIMGELIETGYLPSFCTACYRLGRTGEHFMEFSVPGFIKRFCTPNAILTLAEYLEDYATPELKNKGYAAIEQRLSNGICENAEAVRERLAAIKKGKRDVYF